MKITSESFSHNGPIPEEFAFGRHDARTHFTFAGNRNPHLAWSGVPQGCTSLALIVVDPDAPTVGDDVNKEGRVVKASVPRGDFHHWLLVDIPPACTSIQAGECSSAVTPGGKKSPPGPKGAPGARQGVNDYTKWFAGDPKMGGTYRGYDGPAPPWNDERVHRYHFKLYALDLKRCPVDGDFTAAALRKAIKGHVLAEATLTGTYAINPALSISR